MSLEIYEQKINEYVEKKQKSAPKSTAKGLLAPSKASSKMDKQTRDAVTVVGDFVYALRQKRMELKGKKDGA
jgi:predicted HNH restriction endonuclease